MSAKTETIQVPHESKYFVCNKCEKRIEDQNGMIAVAQYKTCAHGQFAGGLAELLKSMKGSLPPDISESSIASVVAAHVHEDEVQHLCQTCGLLFEQFVRAAPMKEAVH